MAASERFFPWQRIAVVGFGRGLVPHDDAPADDGQGVGRVDIGHPQGDAAGIQQFATALDSDGHRIAFGHGIAGPAGDRRDAFLVGPSIQITLDLGRRFCRFFAVCDGFKQDAAHAADRCQFGKSQWILLADGGMAMNVDGTFDPGNSGVKRINSRRIEHAPRRVGRHGTNGGGRGVIFIGFSHVSPLRCKILHDHFVQVWSACVLSCGLLVCDDPIGFQFFNLGLRKTKFR
jgi:hypothetical protein